MPRKNSNAKEYIRGHKLKETKIKYRIVEYPREYRDDIRVGAVVATAWVARC